MGVYKVRFHYEISNDEETFLFVAASLAELAQYLDNTTSDVTTVARITYLGQAEVAGRRGDDTYVEAAYADDLYDENPYDDDEDDDIPFEADAKYGAAV